MKMISLEYSNEFTQYSLYYKGIILTLAKQGHLTYKYSPKRQKV